MREQESELTNDIDDTGLDEELEGFAKNLREALLDDLNRVKKEKGFNSISEAMQYVFGDKLMKDLNNIRGSKNEQ